MNIQDFKKILDKEKIEYHLASDGRVIKNKDIQAKLPVYNRIFGINGEYFDNEGWEYKGVSSYTGMKMFTKRDSIFSGGMYFKQR